VPLEFFLPARQITPSTQIVSWLRRWFSLCQFAFATHGLGVLLLVVVSVLQLKTSSDFLLASGPFGPIQSHKQA
jgi:hypothetical protein